MTRVKRKNYGNVKDGGDFRLKIYDLRLDNGTRTRSARSIPINHHAAIILNLCPPGGGLRAIHIYAGLEERACIHQEPGNQRIIKICNPFIARPIFWDYDLDQLQFQEILQGRRTQGRLDRDWAVRRLLEYASYEEIIHLIGYKRLVEEWPRWRGWIRSKSRVRGFDFLVKWLPERHPELLRG